MQRRAMVFHPFSFRAVVWRFRAFLCNDMQQLQHVWPAVWQPLGAMILVSRDGCGSAAIADLRRDGMTSGGFAEA